MTNSEIKNNKVIYYQMIQKEHLNAGSQADERIRE